MNATVPPMHAALSVLGTMAGQYLATQGQAAQPPAPVNAITQQSTRNATRSMCDICHVRPKYFDGKKTHSYCGKACATAAQSRRVPNSKPKANKTVKTTRGLCDCCHKQPKYNDGTTTHSYCGKTCAQKAKAAGTTAAQPIQLSKSSRSSPVKNGCLMCGKAVKRKGHFCSQACTSKAEKSAPSVLEVPQGHDTFKSVADQFKTSWRHQTPCPTVRRVHKVITSPASIAKYEAYRAAVEARGNFAASGRSAGNENRRWHGTTRECNLGDNGNGTLCSSQTCSLCCIIRTSYNLNLFGKKTGWGRFGHGIYTSSTSSKSNDYSSNVNPSGLKAMLLNKVVVGKGYKMTQDNTSLTAPPSGYDSVLAEVVNGGSLNYDELVCYTNDAIRPSYLVMYDA
ncbi:ADP-ribosylation [Rhizopogon vinicolor AM-OR11-026]|uniref:ADP-ribosylation n=1 Tax=Rhizopogon vinicolor AM-OR11-026 TaxID=1314800 RepID=A0A1B7N9G0_9AGAM|nr:ADP-ribosylation [Rhizopogon vinicolor AM-OR11-026]